MVNFFIDRPIFAWVIAIVIMLAGALALRSLPVERFPTVAPPSVEIRAQYPGASAQTLTNSVTQVIEQQMTGVDGLLYMGSSSDSTGNARITLTFEPGTDPDIAQVQVQNKLQLAEPRLPQAVQDQGVQVVKANSNFLMVLALISTDGRLDRTDLADFIATDLQDPIGRVTGVGTTQLFGAQYAMRIWLNPTRLTQYELTVGDVISAIEVQNAQVTVGQLGGLPAIQGQQLNATITAQTRLESADQFRRILIKTDSDGARVTLGDIARVELGAEDYSIESYYAGQPSSGMGINLAPGANALDTALRVRERIAELEAYFPEGVEVRFPYDTTPFVSTAIHEVYKTLFEAVLLVFLVMLLFLQNLRATLIPTLAVPVVLLGTFGVMAVAGFSINMLTMFGMVLAIGLLVDDAIVVVENVERVMHEEGLPPLEATRRSMGQITGALIGIGVVLSAVFVPMAFFPGSTGAIYRQFSLTIVTAMSLSVLVALVFTPALCATLLKPPQEEDHGALKRWLGWFNRGMDKGTRGYQASVSHIAKRTGRYTLVYVAIIAVLGVLFMRLPTAFLPEEDQGLLLTQVVLPQGATQERTLKTVGEVGDYYAALDSVEGAFTIAGFGFAGRGQNVGLAFVNLKPWEERDPKTESAMAILDSTNEPFSKIKDGMAFAFNLPLVRGLGNATGFDLQLQDRGGIGHEALSEARDTLIKKANDSPILSKVRANGQEDTPQYRIDIDYQKARALSIPLAEIGQMLSVAWGSRYVNDFLDNGRVKRVYLQGDAPYRMLPEDFSHWYLRNSHGDMVPFSSIASGHWDYGSPRLERYNGVPAMQILGEPAEGYSSGQAMQEMESLVASLGPGIGFEWTGVSLQQQQSGSMAPYLYMISIIVVFLSLAALYESWSIPFAVILVVPLGVLGAVLAALSRDLTNDVFFQVGILTTIGLAAKNAILIVEFARDLQEQGRDMLSAVLEAARIRLRPILMTSMAFTLGVTPLALSSGAGAAARVAIGSAVFGGMLAATFLAIFFIPLFYLLVTRWAGRRNPTTQPVTAGS